MIQVVHWPEEDVYPERWEVFDTDRQESVGWFATRAEAERAAAATDEGGE